MGTTGWEWRRYLLALYLSVSFHAGLFSLAGYLFREPDRVPDTGVMAVVLLSGSAVAQRDAKAVRSMAHPPDPAPQVSEKPPAQEPDPEPLSVVPDPSREAATELPEIDSGISPDPGLLGPPDGQNEKKAGITMTFSVIGPTDSYWDGVMDQFWEGLSSLADGGEKGVRCRESVRFVMTPAGTIENLALPDSGNCPDEMRRNILTAVNRFAPLPNFPKRLGRENVPVEVEVRYAIP